MKTWKLARRRLPCGSLTDCWIESGTPYLELRGQWSRALLRCPQHAGEPVGEIEMDDQPTSRPVESTTKPLRWMANQAAGKLLKMTPRSEFDARAAAARNSE